MNYYSFHIGDYSYRTKHLDDIEDLILRRLLDLYYSTEKFLPLDVDKISRLIGMKDKTENVSNVLSDFFLKSEEGYVNSRCEREIAAYKAKAERAKNANNVRWGYKNDLKSDTKSERNRIPTNNQEPITNSKPSTPKSDDFSVFWNAYPKKVGKGAAEKSWAKMKPDLEFVLAAIEKQKQSDQWRKDGGQFIPNPSTWLNQKRWEDGSSVENKQQELDMDEVIETRYGTMPRKMYRATCRILGAVE